MPPYRRSRSRSRSEVAYSLVVRHERAESLRALGAQVDTLTAKVDYLEESAGRYKERVKDLFMNMVDTKAAVEALTASVAIIFTRVEGLTHKFRYWGSTLQAAWDHWCRNWASEPEPDEDLELAT